MILGFLLGGVGVVSVLFRFIINPMILSFLVVMMGILVMVFLGFVLPLF